MGRGRQTCSQGIGGDAGAGRRSVHGAAPPAPMSRCLCMHGCRWVECAPPPVSTTGPPLPVSTTTRSPPRPVLGVTTSAAHVRVTGLGGQVEGRVAVPGRRVAGQAQPKEPGDQPGLARHCRPAGRPRAGARARASQAARGTDAGVSPSTPRPCSTARRARGHGWGSRRGGGATDSSQANQAQPHTPPGSHLCRALQPSPSAADSAARPPGVTRDSSAQAACPRSCGRRGGACVRRGVGVNGAGLAGPAVGSGSGCTTLTGSCCQEPILLPRACARTHQV